MLIDCRSKQTLEKLYERMAQCDEKHLAKVLKLFTTTALEIGEGQQFDMEFMLKWSKTMMSLYMM